MRLDIEERPQAVRSDWQGLHQELRREHGFEPLAVEGRLPRDLRGTLFRNGPARFERFGQPYGHLFDGDGAVSAVRLTGTAALGAVRFVETRAFAAERRAQRPLFGGYGTRCPSRVRNLVRDGSKNAANTAVLVWQRRLLALYEGGKPTELSPLDLRTVGETDFEGAIPAAFSAHPHQVAAAGSFFNFGTRFGPRPRLDLFELPPHGAARRLGAVPIAGNSLVHDFIATPTYLVFFIPPLRFEPLPFFLGRTSFAESLAWKPEEGTEVVLVPLADPKRALRFRTDPFFQWHFVNAYDRGGEVVVDFVRYPDFSSNAWLQDLPRGRVPGPLDGQLFRAVLDPAGRRMTLERRWEGICEFPRIADEVQGSPHRFTYVTAFSDVDATRRGPPDALAKVDLESGEAVRIPFGPGRYPSEPIFVSRPDGSAEDDGYLLSLVYEGTKERSAVAVFDARDPAAGPLAQAWFDQPLPFTFHGTWQPAA